MFSSSGYVHISISALKFFPCTYPKIQLKKRGTCLLKLFEGPLTIYLKLKLAIPIFSSGGIMKVKILQWHAVASWTWDAQDETCGICRMAFDGCCPDCKFPGDDCPLVWGACNHSFHLHCILKWVNSQNSQTSQAQPHCPMCRREWQFKA